MTPCPQFACNQVQDEHTARNQARMRITVQTRTRAGQVKRTEIEIPAAAASQNYTIGDLKNSFLGNQTASSQLGSSRDLEVRNETGAVLGEDQTLESCGIGDGDTICFEPRPKASKGACCY